MTLPGEIERLRKKVGSHDKLATKLGTSRMTVIRWENGTVPKLKYAKKLAALGVPQAALDEATATRTRRPTGGDSDLRAAVTALLDVADFLVEQVEELGCHVPDDVRQTLARVALRKPPEVRPT